jgi:hypothetical protein
VSPLHVTECLYFKSFLSVLCSTHKKGVPAWEWAGTARRAERREGGGGVQPPRTNTNLPDCFSFFSARLALVLRALRSKHHTTLLRSCCHRTCCAQRPSAVCCGRQKFCAQPKVVGGGGVRRVLLLPLGVCPRPRRRRRLHRPSPPRHRVLRGNFTHYHDCLSGSPSRRAMGAGRWALILGRWGRQLGCGFRARRRPTTAGGKKASTTTTAATMLLCSGRRRRHYARCTPSMCCTRLSRSGAGRQELIGAQVRQTRGGGQPPYGGPLHHHSFSWVAIAQSATRRTSSALLHCYQLRTPPFNSHPPAEAAVLFHE